MRGVEQQNQVMTPTNLGQRLDVTSLPPKMNTNNGRGSGRNQFFNPLWVQTEGLIDVAEDGFDALPLKRMCRGYKCKRWDNDFAG